MYQNSSNSRNTVGSDEILSFTSVVLYEVVDLQYQLFSSHMFSSVHQESGRLVPSGSFFISLLLFKYQSHLAQSSKREIKSV